MKLRVFFIAIIAISILILSCKEKVKTVEVKVGKKSDVINLTIDDANKMIKEANKLLKIAKEKKQTLEKK